MRSAFNLPRCLDDDDDEEEEEEEAVSIKFHLPGVAADLNTPVGVSPGVGVPLPSSLTASNDSPLTLPEHGQGRGVPLLLCLLPPPNCLPRRYLLVVAAAHCLQTACCFQT